MVPEIGYDVCRLDNRSSRPNKEIERRLRPQRIIHKSAVMGARSTSPIYKQNLAGIDARVLAVRYASNWLLNCRRIIHVFVVTVQRVATTASFLFSIRQIVPQTTVTVFCGALC